MHDLAFASAVDLAAAIRQGRTTSRDLVERLLDRIARLDGPINAVVTVDADGARAGADAADRATGDGRPVGPLHGVPMTVKDCFETAGLRTTAGEKELADNVPASDALAVARLREAGVIVLGKTNLPEGVAGQETANELFGRTANPWDGERTPGGSSGGAAAALAAGFTPLELGSDSGGSIRQPAHCCGVFGHLPTAWLVPPRGHLTSVPGDDVGGRPDLLGVGPMARSAGDLEVALAAIAGPDDWDARAWRLDLPPPALPPEGLDGVRLAVWADDPACPVADDVRIAIEAVAEAAGRAGAVVDVRDRPAFELKEAAEAAFEVWVAASSSSTDDHEAAALAAAVATLDPDDESLAARRARAEVMTHRDWLDLDDRRRRLARAWDDLLARHDAVLCPVSPIVAPRHDARLDAIPGVAHRLARRIEVDGVPRPYLDQIVWNTVVGLAGLPSTVAPVGPGRSSGLPVGVQVVGRRFADRTMIALAGRLSALVGGFLPPPALA